VRQNEEKPHPTSPSREEKKLSIQTPPDLPSREEKGKGKTR
jgi:hypothetical protein